MFTYNLKNTATLVYTNSWGYKVYMFLAQDRGTMRRSIGIFIESPSGNLSIPTFLKRSQILKSKNCFDFFFDLDGDFEKLDVDNIKAAVMQNLNSLKIVDLSTKLSIEDVHTELCDYVSANDGNGTVSISNGYCNIDTKAFDGILKGLQFGLTRLRCFWHVSIERSYTMGKYVINKVDLGKRTVGYEVYHSDTKEIIGLTEKQVKDMLSKGEPVYGFILDRDGNLQLDKDGFHTINIMVKTGINRIKPLEPTNNAASFFYTLIARTQVSESKLRALLELGYLAGCCYLDQDGNICVCDGVETNEIG